MRKSITQPADHWKYFEKAAERAGIPLSEWMGRCCAENLPPKIRAKLSDRRCRSLNGTPVEIEARLSPPPKKAPSGRKQTRVYSPPAEEHEEQQDNPSGITREEAAFCLQFAADYPYDVTKPQAERFLALAEKYTLPADVAWIVDALRDQRS